MGLKKSDSEVYRDLLLELQSRVRGDVRQLTSGALGDGDGNGESKSPTHLAERGTDAYEQDFSLRVAENDQELLGEIKDALVKLKEGRFGLCEVCVEEGKSATKSTIGKARLRAIPYARNCIECERKREELYT
ncbi:MAG: TraR/DksA family transcriptional regulator [Planctomycetota bacterium]|nr:TraR/DksA family transcriptional regulator [Planctomycetota bacterium]